MNGVQTGLKCKPNVKRCKRFVFAAHSPLLHPNTLTTKAISHFQADHILTRFVFPPLRDFYYKRWEKYWQVLQDQLDGKLPVLPVGNSSTPTADNPAMTIDWYALEEPWTLAKNTYAASAEGDCIEVAKEAITLINN